MCRLQKDLDIAWEWSTRWQLKFNINKCKVMHFGSKNQNSTYFINQKPLEAVEVERDLGVMVDNKLTFSSHISQAVLKANRLLGLISRSFQYMDKVLLKKLYTVIVRPHLEYANIVWHPHWKKDIELIEKVQHRATRLVPELRSLPYAERLKALDLPTLAYRRLRGDAIETYKFLHGAYRVDCASMIKLVDERNMHTRGHCHKLVKCRSITKTRGNFYSIRIVNAWNGLPARISDAVSVKFQKSIGCILVESKICHGLPPVSWNISSWMLKIGPRVCTGPLSTTVG